MDHSHGPAAAMSDEADPLYRRLGGLEPWAAAPVDDDRWAEALDRLKDACAAYPDWGAMVGRGMLLGAAYASGALDGLYAADHGRVVALLRGEASAGALDETARPHVRANVGALRLSRDVDVSEDSIRQVHEVACRPQPTHRVDVGGRLQDHVLAAGDYKHHPNHVPDGTGGWRATAPVALVEEEMATLVGRVRSPAFADLHPVARAAYLHHALLHIQPFADGNGRAARALAGGCLLRDASIPLMILADGGARSHVELVLQAGVDLVELLTSAPPEGAALDRWRAEEADGEAVRRLLLPAIGHAIDRYGRRPDRRADVSAAMVDAGGAVVIRVPPAVDEVITVEAHRDEGAGPVLITAVKAGLRLEAAPGAPLDDWLDRVVSTLALRVAAEAD